MQLLRVAWDVAGALADGNAEDRDLLYGILVHGGRCALGELQTKKNREKRREENARAGARHARKGE